MHLNLHLNLRRGFWRTVIFGLSVRGQPCTHPQREQSLPPVQARAINGAINRAIHRVIDRVMRRGNGKRRVPGLVLWVEQFSAQGLDKCRCLHGVSP